MPVAEEKTRHYQPSEFIKALSLPPQDMSRLAFCNSNKASVVKNWANTLKATQIYQTSIQLYKALPDLLCLKTDAKTRLEMLELLRPAVFAAAEGLSKDFLNQSLVLPEQAQKAAVMAQSMQKFLADGYCLCVRDTISGKRLKAPQSQLMATAIQRAIHAIAYIFMRNYQLYTQTAPSLWRKLHQLYLVAEHYDLLTAKVLGQAPLEKSATTVGNTYLSVLMLASSKANQVSQKDVQHIFSQLAEWSAAASLEAGPSKDRENIWLVDLSGDEAPKYKMDFKENENSIVLELNLKSLVSLIAKQGGVSSDILGGNHNVTIPATFPRPLIQHLLDAWAHVSQRQLKRTQVQSVAEVSIGLSDSHYCLADKTDFSAFLEQCGIDESAHNVSAFRGSLDIVDHLDQRAMHRVSLKDVSAGGAKLFWSGASATKVQAGELLCFKELGKSSWSLGLVRWIRKFKAGAQLGVQIVSNKAKAIAVAQVHSSGAVAEYSRDGFGLV